MDGLLRRNAGVAPNEYITIKKAEVKDSQTIVFAPTDVRLSVDEEFVGFVKRRFMNMPFVEGDMTLLSIFGSAVPLIATGTHPHGPVKITESTVVQVMSEPTPEKMKPELSSWRGFTIQVYVEDIKRARLWYETLIGRKPDSAPFPEFLEWEIVSDLWFQVVEKKRNKVPRQNRRMRFGVSDIEKERTKVADRMKVKVTEVEGITGIVKWCNFEDPWGNKLGLFQDLEKFP